MASILTSVKETEELKTLFDWTWILLGSLILSVWIGAAIWPKEAIRHGVGLLGIQIEGVMPALAANRVGELAALLAIVCFIRIIFIRGQRHFYGLFFILGLATLILSQSRSSLVGFIVALTLILYSAKYIGTIAFISISILPLLTLTGLGEILWNFFLRGQTLELFASFTGRVFWWKFALGLFHRHPIIGYGAYAGGRFAVLGQMGFGLTSTMHNTWLDVLLGVGLLGLTVFLCVFLGCWVILLHSVSCPKGNLLTKRLALEAIGVFAVLSVRSIFATTLIWHPPLAFLLIVGYAELLRRSHSHLLHRNILSPPSC